MRILFVLTCTNFVAKDVAGKCGYALGGMKSSIAPDVAWSVSLSNGCFWYTRLCVFARGICIEGVTRGRVVSRAGDRA